MWQDNETTVVYEWDAGQWIEVTEELLKKGDGGIAKGEVQGIF